MPNNKRDKAEELNDRIKQLAAACQLDSWNSFVTDMKVPGDIYPALASGRPELIALIQPRDLTSDEAKALFQVIASLIATNTALRDHAEQVAQFVDSWAEAFKQLHSVGDRIRRFARFDRHADDDAASPSPISR